jgi:acyl-CoA thioester hydrolase
MRENSLAIRVYYDDTDCGSVVYYANYLKYMEHGRTEYLRERGIELVEYQQQGVLFAVVEANIKYRASARYNDLLDVRSHIIEITSVSITFETSITNQHGRLCTTGVVRMACISDKGKARRIPEEIAAKLAE